MYLKYRLNTFNQNTLGKSIFVGNTVWKYYSIEGFESLLTKSSLKFTVIEKWLPADCFECKFDPYYLKVRDEDPTIKDYSNMTEEQLISLRMDLMKLQYRFGVLPNGKLAKSHSTDELKALEKKYEKEAFGISLHVNETPNDFMFDSYGKLAIKTDVPTIEKNLMENTNNHFIDGYIEYSVGEWFPPANDKYSVLFQKRKNIFLKRSLELLLLIKAPSW